MYQTIEICTLRSTAQFATDRVIQGLDEAGFQVVRSFDLQVARAAHLNCTCPHHGTVQCDCQMVVLLVYAQEGPPATLVVHGHDGRAQLALVDTLELQPIQQRIDGILRAFLTTFEQNHETNSVMMKERSQTG